uniref:Ig-like domain-containing protein n=1 Tax=Glossina morsitans morsitans TaxID=37546 RepID=A0A1B0GCK6_GLOMM
MDLHGSSTLTAAYSRRSYCFKEFTLHTLLLLGLWISNAIIGCTGLPHPRPQLSNSISKGNDYDANVAVNSDFTLKCEDSEPIIWKYPMEATVDEIQHKTEDKNRPFGSTLTLLDVNYVFVGNYYCIKAKSLTKDVQGMEDAELTDLSNSNLASSIYIYVNDTENFLAPMLFPVIHVMQFQDAVIPCKPSMPNVDVLLTTPTGKTLASDSPVRYNPRLGFVIELRNFQESGLYVCRPKIPPLTNEEESTEIELILDSSEYTQLDTSFSGDVDSSSVPSPTTPSSPAANSRTISSSVTNHVVNVTNRTIVNITEMGDQVLSNNLITVIGEDVKSSSLNALSGIGYHYNGDEFHLHTTTVNSNQVNYDDEDISVYRDDDNDDKEDNEIELAYEIEKGSELQTMPIHFRFDRDVQTTTRRSSSHHLTYTTHVDKPNVTSTAKHHAYEGDTFQLKCETKIAHDVRYKIEWIMPVGVDKHSLTVKDAKKSDTGNYICNIIDHSNNQARNSYRMIIMEKGTSYINISEPNDYYVIREKANKTIQMTVRYSGYPWPTLTWYRPDGSEILPVPNQKFNITTTESSSTLKISNPRLLDSGTYVINATNGYTTKSQQFNVSISDIPIVSVDDVFVQADEKAHVICQVQSHPISLITWVFTPCSIAPRWPSCDKKVIQDFNETSSRDGETPIEIIYDLYFVPKTPGIIHCKAENKIGSVVGRAHVLIRDIEANMTISGVTDEDVIARGDQVAITCAAVAYYFSDEINWFKEDLLITKFSSEYSYQTTLTFKNIQDSDRGAYECRARHINHDEVDYKFVDLFIHEPSAPRMKDTNLGGNVKIERKLGDSLELKCVSEAIPKATIDWYKDEIKIATNASNLNSDNDPRSGTRAGRPNSTGYITQSELYEGQLNTCATEQTVMTTVPEDDDNNIIVNSEYMKRNQTDYLALMGAPDEMAPPPPRYVNGHILPEIPGIDLSSDDYLQMSPNNGSVIFSPTRPKETAVINDNDEDKLNLRQPLMTTTSFTFPDTAAQQHSPTLANNLDSHLNKARNKKDGVEPIPEEIPMLANANSQASPEQSAKFSQLLQQAHRNTPTPSPRHHVAETKLTADAENYVNLKSPKRLLNNNGSSKGPEAFSNPGYQILKTVAEKVDNN